MTRKRRVSGAGRVPMSIGAGEFKTHCLVLMEQVAAMRREIVITKRGKPIAKLVPVDEQGPDSFGALRGSVKYLGDDIVSPDHEAWSEGGT